MFSDKNADEFPPIGFTSDWRKTLSLKTSDAQTDPLKTADAEAQTKTMEDASVQTDDTSTSKSTADPSAQLSLPSLVKFLVRATPMLERELDAAARSRAFDGYSLIEEETEKNVRKLHTLETPGSEGTRVSAVSWSCSGAVLAVAYELVGDHEQWCDHETTLNVWNLTRRDFDPGTPHQQLSVGTCLTDAKFHPTEPSFVLAGGFTGEIFVWEVLRQGSGTGDALVASSAMQGHREKVTALQWITPGHVDSTLKSTRVMSAALDGRMIMWAINVTSQVLTPTRVFLLQAEHLPRSLRVRTRSQTEVGVTCTAINCEDGDIVMIGTEAGVVFQGLLGSEVPIAPGEGGSAMGDEVEWRDPVSVAFAAHRGRVVDVRCSPFHRDVFLSLGSDQEIRICSLLSPHAPLHVMHQEEGAQAGLDWSPVRPMVFAAAAQGCTLRLFDMMASRAGSVLTLRAAEKVVTMTMMMTAVAFNGRDRSLLASGDAAGRAHVWRLNEALSSAGAAEGRGLEAMMATAEEEE